MNCPIQIVEYFMFKSVKIIVLSLCIICIKNTLNSQNESLRKEVDKIIKYDADFDYVNHPGFIIAIIDNDSTWILPYYNDSLHQENIFEIGGVSKVFTSLYALKLIDEQKLKLSDTINNLLPNEFRNEALNDFTIQDLLTHRIPFPKRPDDLAKKETELHNPYLNYSKKDLLNFYRDFNSPHKSRFEPNILHYSHVNHSLLEIIIEQIEDRPFDQIINEFLVNNLGLRHSNFSTSGEHIVQGYGLGDQEIDPLSFSSFNASEGMKSTLEDLISFVLQNLDRAPSELIKKSQEKIEKAKVSKQLSFSPAWYILKYRRSPYIYTHSGATEGHKAYVHFCPDTGTGVVILSQSVKGTGELGLLILRMINYNWKRKSR